MAQNKRISVDTAEGAGLTVYAVVRREADGWLLNDGDGGFAQAPADPFVALAEDAVIRGRYETDEGRSLWDDGLYTIVAYLQTGGAPAPAADVLIGSGAMVVLGDAEVTLQRLDAAVSSRVTVADLAGAITSGVLQRLVTVTDGSAQYVVRGDARTLVLQAGSGWDFTDRTVWFMAKADARADNATAIVNRQCTVTDAAGGVAEITLTPEETSVVGSYAAEFESTRTDGSEPQTVLRFELKITQDVRQ